MVSWSPEASSQNNGACSGTPPRTLHLGQVFHRFCTPIRSPCFGGHEKLITPLRSSVRGLENPIRQPRFGLPVPLVLYHRPGCGSALRPSVSSRRVSSSSPGRTISSQSSPCLSALRRTAAFPSGVLPGALECVLAVCRCCPGAGYMCLSLQSVITMSSRLYPRPCGVQRPGRDPRRGSERQLCLVTIPESGHGLRTRRFRCSQST
jgi:hypothetical protein